MFISYNKTIIAFTTMIIFCAPLSNDRDRPIELRHQGMKLIQSAGKSFQQGWNNTLASYDEKPGMQTSFTYDYWLDTTEVTQKQYYEITGKRPVTDSSQYGVGDNYPVYYVSWFDAALYCNARSKAEHLDTVYVYSGIKAMPNGTVYELTGLRYDVSRDGYRLPTESEWEFAARGGTSALPFSAAADSSYAYYYAWFTVNSSGRTHAVATLLPNSLGLYDMAGNVFEWTNDWKCMYDGKNITNSLGALQPSSAYEKVIKGGSYNYPLMYLRPSHRSATYPTMLSSSCEYVGFRCARGAIPNGQYIGTGQSTSTNPVNIQISANDLRSFIGTSETKLAFVNVTGNDRTLCYIDFSGMFPYVWEYLDDRNVHLPTISPDGRYVAYCSGDVGQSGPSKITIRSLDSLGSPRVALAPDTAYVPRWWLDQFGNTYIVWTNSACDDGGPSWPSTKTYEQFVSEGTPVGTPQELTSDGSYHGGISLDARYAVTGYRLLIMKNLSANSTEQLFLSPHNGKDGNGSTQVCNVSISPDTGSSVRCLFLDFGYSTGISTVTGCSYGQHEYVFVSTMSDSIVNYIHCPAGEQEWDNPNWSNKSEFAVGCGRNNAEQAHAIYAIDLDTRNVRQVATGTELQEPYLWIGFLVPNPSNFALDSIGRYNDPPAGGLSQAQAASQFLMFWRLFDSLQIAVIGSSQVQGGIDPSMFTQGLKSYNFAASGFHLPGEKHLILHYIISQCPAIKLICSSLDIGTLGYIHCLWASGVGQSKGFIYDSCHNFWPGGASTDFKNIIRQVPLPIPFVSQNMGYFGNPCTNWGPDPPNVADEACGAQTLTWDTTDIYYRQNLATMTMLADTLRSKGVHWIVISFPVSPLYKKYGVAYTDGGPSWQTALEINQNLRELERSNAFFHFYNANMDGDHDYTSEEFSDENHLSSCGAEKLSVRLNTLIDSILH
jgi:uncharacterized protein (TIGR02171 family)